MQKNKGKNCRKRFFSIVFALVLFIGSFSTIPLPTVANSAISTQNYQLNENIDQFYSTDEDLIPVEYAIEPVSLPSISENTSSDIIEENQEGNSSSLSDNNVEPSQPSSGDDKGSSDSSSNDSITENEENKNNEVDEETDHETVLPPTTYTLTIDYNGGIDADGKTSYQVQVNPGDALSTYLKEAESKNFYSPYTFAKKWVLSYTDTGEADKQNFRRSTTTKKITDNYTLKAQWNNTYATFNIHYVLFDGKLIPAAGKNTIPYTYTYNSETITLPCVQKKGYLFKGFYKDAAFTLGPVTTIPKNTMGDISLYAKLESVAPSETPVLTKATNPSKGTVTVNFKKMQNISGYELLMSTNKNFKKKNNVITLDATATSAKLTNMPSNKTYYFKLRGFIYDSTGEKAYSPYSKVITLKVTKGVKEYKATSNSAKLKSCKIQNGNTLIVKFKATKRIKSSDDSYYLVRLNPSTDKYEQIIEASPKLKTLTFELPLRDVHGNDLIQGKYALAIKNKKSYKIISKAAFISNPQAAASYTGAFPTARSKKGLQGSTDPDLNLSHTFFNIDLNKILNGTIPYVYNGKTYHFNDPWGHIISACNEAGLTVTGQIMLSYNENTKYMILKSGRTPGKPYYAINVKEKDSRETFEAVMSFLAERYGKEDCHLDNWVLGNEVNIHQSWYYAGNISRSAFMKNYASTFRIMYYAVRSHSANSRVYICTDHTWSDRHNDWGAKPFMDAFHKEIKAQQKNIQWNLAYHAYPSVLTSAATWNDKYVTNKTDTEFVSPKNLSVLTKYVKKKFGKNTRIILSEQGFTSSSGTDVQAAAIAYTYYKAEFDPMIDAIIFRSDIDNTHEGAQGLYMGLKDLSGNKKPAYNVFKYMDTPQAENYTNAYLKTIGISKWKDIAPKYTLNRFK